MQIQRSRRNDLEGAATLGDDLCDHATYNVLEVRILSWEAVPTKSTRDASKPIRPRQTAGSDKENRFSALALHHLIAVFNFGHNMAAPTGSVKLFNLKQISLGFVVLGHHRRRAIYFNVTSGMQVVKASLLYVF